jgi:hypothetical protein
MRVGASNLRLSAALLLAGQLLYIVATLLHAGGEANNHPAIFATYAASGTWKLVHLGQFVSMAIMLMGLLGLFFALDDQDGVAKWAGRFGGAFAVVALALYGVLQAVDGVALKHAVNAWASAPEAERAARFASAETVRWLEWGVRSYQDTAQGLALILFAGAVGRTGSGMRLLACLMALSGLVYLVQGWVAGSEGFTQTQSIAIVLAWALNLIWMIWLAVIAWGRRVSEQG